jgi:hypothetical protein
MDIAMKTRTLAVLLLATLAAALSAVASAQARDGLSRVRSSNLDEVYIASNAQLADYRAVMVDAPKVAFDPNWRRDINSTRQPSRWVTAADQQEIAADLAADLPKIFADVFEAKGYDIATAPGPGVLRLTPAVQDLFINAPDVKAPNDRKQFSGESAGDATLVLEARDAGSGALVARIVDHADAHQLRRRFNLTTSVSNRFWMDALFRQWATYAAGELQRGDKIGAAAPR